MNRAIHTFHAELKQLPTYMLSILQGFGAGNFKSLFEAIEADQAERGNLWALWPSAPPHVGSTGVWNGYIHTYS